MKLHSAVLPKNSSYFWFSGGLSFPRWKYTDILTTLERLSKPRCRGLASATSPEHFIAHKSCSQLIKQCWSEPRNHENVKCSSPPFPLIRDFCCCFFRGRVRSFIALNVTLTLVRMLPLLNMGIFCAQDFLDMGFLTQKCPWWASCSPALTLLWNWFFSPHLYFNPSLSSQQGWNCHAIVLGTTTLFLPAKELGCLPTGPLCSLGSVLQDSSGCFAFCWWRALWGWDRTPWTSSFSHQNWSSTLFLLKVIPASARLVFKQVCSDSGWAK